MTAIYSIKIVSEEIARAYAHRTIDVMAYDAPIVTREQHQAAMRQVEEVETRLRYRVQELERRLTSINALPVPNNTDWER
jgi:predicted nuclease with RNAse H fold